jgi:hypothetical protein
MIVIIAYSLTVGQKEMFTRQQQIKKQLVIVCLSVKFHTPINKQSQADKGMG